ncbi:MAG TPA: DUF4349 domain-containing protein [Actinomycetota bacterium]|nr:DUF4349 domain-containing protein [Actinomycetota bacterium]
MNTDIRYLQQLETDFEHVAAQERRRAAAKPSGRGGRGSRPPRRPTHRDRRWPSIAAAVVTLLIVAGSIGFLSQQADMSSDDSGGADALAPAEVPADGPATWQARNPNASAAPAPGQALTDGDTSAAADEQGGRSLDYSVGDTKTPAGIGTTPQAQGDLSKIIRDGRIEVVVPTGEFAKNVTAVTRIAGTNGGFVLTSSTQNGQAGQFTLRIPAKRFDRAMDQLRGLGTVQSDAVTGDDVTAEFVDLQARLGILTDRRDLLRDLQSEATSSSEILRFATLIDQVQLEIENIQGQLNFIRDQVAEGTIKVSLRELGAPEAQEQQPTDVDKPSLGTAFNLALQGFLRVLGAVVVGLGYLIPIGVIALIAWFVVRLVRRRDREAS